MLAVRALAAHRVEALVLRGPAISNRLYGGRETRAYDDVDLLVESVEAAEHALVENGYRCQKGLSGVPGESWRASIWRRQGEPAIELQEGLPGAAAAAEAVWRALVEGAKTMELHTGNVRVPGDAALALTIALHAARRGRRSQKPLADLERALIRLDESDWVRAGLLAQKVASIPTFAAGLRLLPSGAALTERLRLPSRLPIAVRLQAAGAPRVAVALAAVLEAPSVQLRLRLLAHAITSARLLRLHRPR